MKSLNFFSVGFILTGLALTACENDENGLYRTPEEIRTETEYSDEYLHVLRFTVNARHWQNLSSVDRIAEISIPAVTDSIVKYGGVMFYLHEAEKFVHLPFTYYQMRRAMLFQPSYEEGRVYINILGNFICNVNTSYTFKVIVVNKKGLKKYISVNWQNYEAVKQTIYPTN